MTFLSDPARKSVESRGADAFVLGDQVVGERVEVGDAADLSGQCHYVIAASDQAPQQVSVLGVALREVIVWMVVVALFHRAVLLEIVDADDDVARVEQLLHQIAADETRRACD